MTAGPRRSLPLPEPRQDVVIVLPGGEGRQGRVLRVSDDELVIVLMHRERALPGVAKLTPGETSSMVVEFTADRGLVRLRGTGTVATDDAVRFRHGDAELVQRRDFFRVHVARPLRLARVGADGLPERWFDTLTVNVSGNGLLAAGGPGLQVGDTVSFALRLDDSADAAPVAGSGRVVRIADDRVAIAIERIDPDASQRLVGFVFEQERLARQRTRDAPL